MTEENPSISEPVLAPESELTEASTPEVIPVPEVIATELPQSEQPQPAISENVSPPAPSSPTPAAPPIQSAPAPVPAAPPPVPVTETAITMRRAQALEKRKAKKEEKLGRIVAHAQKRRSITNNDVQLLLGVSHASATRYLSELVKSGRLRRVGKQKRPIYEPAT